MRKPLKPQVHWFPHFQWALYARLDQGAKTYGDASFAFGRDRICREVMSEMIDVPGWLFVLWRSLQRKSPRTHDRARLKFLRVISDRILSGDLQGGAQLADRSSVIREIERVAACSALAWWKMRTRMQMLSAKIGSGVASEDPRPTLVDQDVKRGQRGGVRD